MKEIRQRTIRKILGRTQVQNQDELLNLLAVEGIQTTQATLSRDLKEMRVVKLHKADGGYFFSIPAESMHVVPDAAHSTSGIVSLEISGQLAVIRTRPGYANMLGAVVDASVGSAIMGTIAGDDTLLLILRQETTETMLIATLTRFLPGIEDKVIRY
ncbi:MAG: hypothetical protein J6S66_05695 [Bacteroidales bacterium]|nr:hypothetical protein [Bacteroidales bacterium]